MKEFYYQIKGRGENIYGGNWSWPPIFSGKVEAEDKKKARLIIEDDYCRKFPLRVLEKDLANESFLLNIREIQEGDTHTKSLFSLIKCKQCETKFTVIDKYNDDNCDYKGNEFCTYKCKTEHQDENRVLSFNYKSKEGVALIYKITNINTGLSYVGKTTQIFTLRWYQHFFQGGDCKFHRAITSSEYTDWQFSVVEVVNSVDGKENSSHVADRENFWINKLDSISNGYNSVSAKKESKS